MSEFTKEQQQVIDVRNRDVLVSAAAGSGKTTVLVERIIGKITDKEHPIDIDHILVVTFTKAAAKEMREKIRNAIEKKSMEDKKNSHLKKQASFVFHSQITTIDSFCNYIVKNYFYTIGVEPDFRILDAGEYKLIEGEIIDELLEENYKNNPLFQSFSDTYSKKNSDDEICNMILSLAKEAMTNPWPMEWLDEVVVPYEIASAEALEETEMMKQTVEDATKKILSYRERLEPLYQEHISSNIETSYGATLLSDYELLSSFSNASSYSELYDLFQNLTFADLRGKKKDDDLEFKQEFKSLRDEYKKVIKDKLRPCFDTDVTGIYQSIQNQKPYVELLSSLAKQFIEKRYCRLEKMNAWDFNDIEHFALEVLIDKETKEPREAAMELQELYDEIMVDEYQDSNYLQEEILRTITKESLGRHNYFMVGDIKQSIYRFRQARPEIFGAKYDTFTKEESQQQKIELDKNFRSRKQILETTNDIFMELMDKSVGNVSYDESVSLKPGAKYPDEDNSMFQTEIMIGIKDKEEMLNHDIEDKSELESVMIANRIEALMKDFLVYDRSSDTQRRIKYSDIVILLRSHTNEQAFVDVLNSRGIPAYAEKTKGYFNSTEVQAVMAFLKVLDNPRQDIPLTTVMHSPMFGFTNEELAKIRVEYPKDSFYKAVFSYAIDHEENQKIQKFLSTLEELREMVEDTPIHMLLQEIYSRTNYLSYVYSLPSGELRRGNLYKLIDLAINYENTSFKGLFRFCNYIDKLQKYESEMGEVDLLGEDDDVVRVMTIHHSKGLEFPVVFLAEVSKEFNKRDLMGSMIIHSHAGIALDEISVEKRTKKTPLMKRYIKNRILEDSYGEEMRILYVAMTRAKEKLIITGTYEEDKIPEVLEGEITNHFRLNSKGYGDWMLPILQKYKEKYPITLYNAKDLVTQEVEDQLSKETLKADLDRIGQLADSDSVEKLSQQINRIYEHITLFDFKGKYSVSELKHRAMDLKEEEESVEVFQAVEQKETTEPNMGALKGTAMHRFMECFDFTKLEENGILEKELKRIQEKKLMKEDEILLLDKKKLEVFLESNLAREMSNAAKKDSLLKEQPFVMGDTPKALLSNLYEDKEFPEGEDVPLVLIQGIIDAFYITEEGLVLVDYKTDRVSSGEELIDRYREQMDLYQKAMEQSYHRKVIKKVLYSFSLGKEVVL
ncbi:MAG: helicase-exonuclease AddAB subunit AddA [Lachnospiraceae bacterium]|nr:helicase-exonuclease AddAB subunit AddA [Lachnospiraceae bacterium]